MQKTSFAVIATVLALVSGIAEASAGRYCPPGTHLGYEGKYCWANRGHHVCNPGFHLSFNGQHCWRNR